jgi:SAM-dependent methyltransferase
MKQAQTNAIAWNHLYTDGTYNDAGCHLPYWGTNGAGKDLTNETHLPLFGKDVLEVGCGTGASIDYVIKSGAKSVSVCDVSSVAIDSITNPKVYTSCFDISENFIYEDNSFDTVFAIYSIGWSQNISHTLQEIHRILRSGGTFMFSWDHQVSRITELQDGNLVVTKNYHKETILERKDWRGTGNDIKTIQSKPSEWFALLLNTGFRVDGFWEPEITANTNTVSLGFSNNYALEKSIMLPSCVLFKATKI